MRNKLLLVLLSLVSFYAIAQSCNIDGVYVSGSNSGSTANAAVDGNAAALSAVSGTAYTYSRTGNCTPVLTSPYSGTCAVTRTPVQGVGCPVGGPCPTSSVNFNFQFQCNTGTITIVNGELKCSATGPACGDCAAKAGQTKIQNFTLGWTRSNTPNADDMVITVGWPPATSCDGSCLATVGPVQSGWRSQVPAANGLHRLSGDFPVTFTGATCTTITPGADPNTPPPSCPGFTGQVNGRPVCVGTPTTPLPATPRPDGLPPDGYGNPAAGNMPDSGSGSGSGPGRTPTVGSGGNAGGGSNATTPGGGSEGNGQGDGTPNGTGTDGRGTGSGSGTTPADPVEVCGLPGKPTCKIDETGTPDGTGADGAANALKGAGDALSAAVSGVQKPSDLGWSFSVTLPTGSCTDFQMYKPGGSWGVGLCDNSYVQLLRDLLAWAFGIATAVYCYRSVTRTISSQD